MGYDPAADPQQGLERRLLALAGRDGERERAKSRFLRHLLDTLDFGRYRDMQAGYLGRPKLGTYVKFLDLGYWMDAKFDQVWQFGLHRGPPRRILDVGAGIGNFVYICRYFGHDALAFDIGKVAIYDELIEIFGVPRIIGRVEAGVPLPDLGHRFDLITAFLVVFDKRKDKSGNWHEPEWRFFLRDLARNQLTGKGEVLLKISLKNYDAAFRAFLEESGAEVTDKGSFVHYRSLDCFRD